jgi:ABC-type multidrug transport system fused ATPase/permease subunit
MKLKYDRMDEDKAKALEEALKKGHISPFKRILNLAEPGWLVPIGLIFSLFLGTVMPIFGIILTKLLFGLSHPPNPLDKVRENADLYCLLMLCCAVGGALFVFMQKLSFGRLGETVTLKIRRNLYSSILSKHIGWFDAKENSPG